MLNFFNKCLMWRKKGNLRFYQTRTPCRCRDLLGNTVYVGIVSVCDSQLLRTRAATFLMWPHIFVLIMGQGTHDHIFSDVPDLGGWKSRIKGALILMLPPMLCDFVLWLPTCGSCNMWGKELCGGGRSYELKPCFLLFENSLNTRGWLSLLNRSLSHLIR